MAVRLDPAANLIGRYEGADPEAPALLIGSHIDSVPATGGFYDGPLGVMLGIECAAALDAAGHRLPFPIEVIAFGDEEGSRFPASMLTSRAVAGGCWRRTRWTWRIARMCCSPTPSPPSSVIAAEVAGVAQYLDARHAPALAYLEAHIEQGPVLEAEGLPIGIVTGIAAQLRYQIAVTGTAGHAGTTTMPLAPTRSPLRPRWSSPPRGSHATPPPMS